VVKGKKSTWERKKWDFKKNQWSCLLSHICAEIKGPNYKIKKFKNVFLKRKIRSFIDLHDVCEIY